MDTENTQSPNSKKQKEHFPLFKSAEDAAAYSEKTGDNYYFTAFMLECWLGDLITKNVNKYADKNPAKREMQTGEAFRHVVFGKFFSESQDRVELAHFISSLLRFAGEENNFSEIITQTYGLFGTENSVNPVVPLSTIRPGPGVMDQMRRYICRFCGWLDCVLHHQTHFMSYLAPGSFIPGDEEARHLFALGLSERAMPELSAYDQTFWRWNHESALERLTKPDKWKFLADGVKNEGKRHQTHPEIDSCLIAMWPLVKRFNWSYNELLTVLNYAVPECAGSYPCDYYISLQKHCLQTLGLKKGIAGQRGSAGKPTRRLAQGNPPPPEGFDIVKALKANHGAARRKDEGM